MKVFTFLLAILFSCLTIGGLMSAAKGADTPSRVGDLIISALLGWVAVSLWKRTATARSPRADDPSQPKHR